MTVGVLLEHAKLLSDVIRTVKANLDDFIFTTDNPNQIYVMNSESSVIYVVTIPDNSPGWLPYKTHVVGAVKTFVKNMECASDMNSELRFDNIIFDAFNPYLYPTTLHMYETRCRGKLGILLNMVSSSFDYVIDSEDMLTDPYYEFVFNTIFPLGTGVSDIIRTKHNKALTIYKGLIPYTSKDKIALSTMSISPREFLACYRISKIKPTKSSMTVDMYTRCLDIMAPQHLNNN